MPASAPPGRHLDPAGDPQRRYTARKEERWELEEDIDIGPIPFELGEQQHCCTVKLFGRREANVAWQRHFATREKRSMLSDCPCIGVPSKRNNFRQIKVLEPCHKSLVASASAEPPAFICVALEEQLLSEYADKWPHLFFLRLPRRDRGVGYSRFVLKRACCSLGFRSMWMMDDNVTFHLHPAADATRRCFGDMPARHQPWTDNTQTNPIEPLRWAQDHYKHCDGLALIGFARLSHGGGKSADRQTWDCTRFNKVVWINLELTNSIDYIAGLKWPEDICFHREVMGSGSSRAVKVNWPYRNNSSLGAQEHSSPIASFMDLLADWRRDSLNASADQLTPSQREQLIYVRHWMLKSTFRVKEFVKRSGGLESLPEELVNEVLAQCPHCDRGETEEEAAQIKRLIIDLASSVLAAWMRLCLRQPALSGEQAVEDAEDRDAEGDDEECATTKEVAAESAGPTDAQSVFRAILKALTRTRFVSMQAAGLLSMWTDLFLHRYGAHFPSAMTAPLIDFNDIE